MASQEHVPAPSSREIADERAGAPDRIQPRDLPAPDWPSPAHPEPTPDAGARVRRSTVAPSTVLVVASIAVFMAFLDDSVVGIAFPNILRSFPQATIAELSWVFNAYNIAFAAFLIPAGRLADLLGRRRMFSFGAALFTAASALCAIAPSPVLLICARFVQGIGAAVLVPSSLAMVLEAHPPGERVRAVGVWAATAALAAGFGPAIGGVLVNAYDWRLVFLVNLPIGLAVVYLARRELVESRAPGRRELPDLVGALILAVTVSALSLAIAQGPVWGWASPGVIAAAAGALAGAITFVRRCRVHAAPVLDLALVRAPGFAAIAVLTFVGAAGFFTLGLANVLFLMDVWRYSPLTAGLALTPAPFVAAPTAILAGRLAAKRDPRILVVLGAAVLTAGAAVLVLRMGARPDYVGAYLPAAVLLAIGIGLAFPLVSDAAVSDAPRDRYAGATALNTAIRLVGGALGVAILAALLGHGHGPDLVAPFRRAWGFAAICFGALAAVAFGLPRFRSGAVEAAIDELPARVDAPAGRVSRTPKLKPVPATAAHVPSTPLELLGSVPLFAVLAADQLRALADRAAAVHLSAGEWLFRQGDEADALYVLRSGRLEVCVESSVGDRGPVRELGVGSVVGELALLSQAPRSASVRCRRDAELLCLARAPFEELMESAPGFAAGVSRALAMDLQRRTPVDAEPLGSASSIAIVTLGAAAGHAGVAPLLRRELEGICSVAALDRARTSELHGDAATGAALARALDRLEHDHEIVLLNAAAEDAEWTLACVRQADRTVLVVAEAAPDEAAGGPSGEAALLPLLRGCDTVLLEPASSPRLESLLDALAPRSTHRIAQASFTSDVARLARRLASRSVGLVLSGGGARAFAHIGVIEELLAAGIVIDRVGGTSMGAYVGAMLAQGMDAAQIDARCHEEWVRRSPLSDYGLPRHALLRGARLRAMLDRTLEGRIEDLPRSFYCTATDVIANELLVDRRGEIADAVAASMAVPGVLPPVIRGDRLLFDGAVLDGLPVSIMAADAEGPIIACDVTERGLREHEPGEAPRMPTLMNTLANLAFLATTDTVEQAGRHAELMITPSHESVGALEFHMLDSLRESGRRATLTALEGAPASIFG
jgi:NTE family protein